MTEVQSTPHESSRIPAPPPFALSTDLTDDEHDVDLDDDGEDPDQGDDDDQPRLRSDTIPEGIEPLGSYPSLEAYFRAMLEPEIQPGVHWILDLLDYSEVQRRWESDGSRLMCERGCAGSS